MISELQSLMDDRLKVTSSQIAAFCQRWNITELALFGSVLRDDFRPDSDIDLLVTFAPDPVWSLFDWVDMKEELEAMLDRKVDIADKEKLKNPYRRYEILRTCQVLYESK
ncbi:MAG: nucleotidyltransferase family protein [Drouetiella hepatica Uher 2000/2452]|jgi:hypothetical protein|uniref:Nucleotidyltransferase family protein n=1 Tax=Drouetiella hepatica Uher 2000/2452 TaxID=904376 RepID=A0A951QAX0_9CYAN|nr:nucleotidyltransferase family protein [Drouetiella hepatica Uher 2000/2452]